MRAWVISKTGVMTKDGTPLEQVELPKREPAPHEVRIAVSVCGMCHTELDEIEGRTAPPVLPIVPGHQIVGTVDSVGENVTLHETGDRVGVGWIFDACGECEECGSGRENLCKVFRATGRDAHGGYAEYVTVPQKSAYGLPRDLSEEKTAPLLCAGAVGFRSLRLCGLEDGMNLGLTGFGASAHIVLSTARYLYPNSRIFVFARRETTREFALSLGASWAGGTEESPPEGLHSIIDTTPVWLPVIRALEFLRPGGRLVINAIRKEDKDKDVLQELSYHEHLWMEKEVKSVANVTRRDIADFLPVASEAEIHPEVELVDFDRANLALLDMKFKGSKGARVLRIKTEG
jgi:propanol-preferring alcohol dehydrogenase